MPQRTRADSPTKTCTEPECDSPLRARGLCSTHYNEQHQPNRHAKIEVVCSYCGGSCMKEQTGKYGARFCSFICRDLFRIEEVGDPLIAARAAFAARAPRPQRMLCDQPAWPKWDGKSCAIERKTCAWCGVDFYGAIRMTRAYCTTNCKRQAKRQRRRGYENALSYGQWTWMEFMYIAKRFDYRCAYCSCKPDRLDPEHVIPVAKGGPNTITNLLPACHACNSDKRDLTLEEWAVDRERRGLPPRITSWTPEDRRVWHLTSISSAA